jgi:uncharacterized repeat protein (TIGR01451 family)
MTRTILIAALALALTSAMQPRTAGASAHVALRQSVAAIEVQNGAPAAIPLRREARPGDRLRFTIVATNDGDRPVTHLMPAAKIPAGERFVATSAGSNAELSIDGGKTYARHPFVRVTHPDGTTTMRPALAREINALRWVTPVPLAPGAHLSFAYDITVE